MSCILSTDLLWTKLVLEFAVCVNVIIFGYLGLDSNLQTYNYISLIYCSVL